MKVGFFRFAVFGIWLVTLLAVVVAFLVTIVVHDMTFGEAQDALESVAALVVPQVTIMLAFFFGSSARRQRSLAATDRGIVFLAVAVSFVYHAAFWLMLFLAIVFGQLAKSIDGNAEALVKIMSVLSALGLAPVAYLFSKSDENQHTIQESGSQAADRADRGQNGASGA